MNMKSTIMQFFIHEFKSMKQVLFQGDYYVIVTNLSSVHIFLKHEVTDMCVVTEVAQRSPGDDIRVVALIIYKVIAMPICGQICMFTHYIITFSQQLFFISKFVCHILELYLHALLGYAPTLPSTTYNYFSLINGTPYKNVHVFTSKG